MKCEYIPLCSLCKLYKPYSVECDVDIPPYIPKEQVEKLLQDFKEKYHK